MCHATWRSEQRAIRDSIAISAPLVAEQALLVTSAINDPAIFSSEKVQEGSDLNPGSPGNPKRAHARKARVEPSYESEFVLIWNFTGKHGSKFKAQESWIGNGRPAFTEIQAKYTEYKASLPSWRSEKDLATWFNQWGHKQDYQPAPPEPKRNGFAPPAVRAEEARQERIQDARFKRIQEELKPRQSAPSPREQYRASQGGQK